VLHSLSLHPPLETEIDLYPTTETIAYIVGLLNFIVANDMRAHDFKLSFFVSECLFSMPLTILPCSMSQALYRSMSMLDVGDS
jgi:hypothetical protein